MGLEGKGKNTSRLVALAVHIPFTFLFLLLALCLLCSFFVFEFVSLSDPLAGLRLREADYARKADAFLSAVGSDEIDVFWQEQESSASEQKLPERQQSKSGSSLLIMYLTEDNVFTPERLAIISELERNLLSVQGYEEFCLRPSEEECGQISSPIAAILGENITSQEEINASLVKAWNENRRRVERYFTKEWDPDSGNFNSRYTKTTISFGFPLAGFQNKKDRSNKQDSILSKWLLQKGGFGSILEKNQYPLNGMRIVYGQKDILQDIGTRQVLADTKQCVFAGIAIYIMMLFHMKSVFLATAGVLQILLSFPTAFFIYRIICGLELFGALHCLAIFIVLGVGADDCFIYLDAFKQASTFKWDLERRLSFAYDKAKFTMMITTFTNAFAFLSLSTSGIPIVRFFGVFAFFLIITNFLMVLSIFTALLVIWDRHIRNKSLCHVRSTDTAVSGVSHYTTSTISNDNSLMFNGTQAIEEDEVGQNSMAKLERFRNTLVSRIQETIVTGKGNRIVIFAFACVIVSFSLLLPRLELSAGLDQLSMFWDEEHLITIVLRENPWAFHGSPSQQGGLFHLVYGLDKPYIDRSEALNTDVLDLGEPIFSSKFQIAMSSETQSSISKACQTVFLPKFERSRLKIGASDPEEYAGCFLLAFQLWRNARNESFPIEAPSVVTPLLNISFPRYASLAEDSFDDAIVEFFKRPFFRPLRKQLFLERSISTFSGQIYEGIDTKMAFNSFSVEIDSGDEYNERLRVEKEWVRVLDEVKHTSSSNIPGDIFFTHGDYFVDMQRQTILIITAFVSLLLALLLALFFLVLATNNYIVSTLAFGCILGIVVVMFGFIILLKWEIDTIVSVSITILVGFSIDYVVHFAIAFDEAFREKGIVERDQKAKYAFSTMGGSIVAGAASTLAAAIMLFPTVVVFFSKFGAFLCAAVAVAIVFASILLPAILSRWGPKGGKGVLFARLETRKRNIGSIYNEECHIPLSMEHKEKIKKLFLLIYPLIVGVVILVWAYRTERILVKKENNSNSFSGSAFASDEISFSDMENNTWYRVSPGGNATCGRGSPYSFFVKKGSSNLGRFVVEFQGGGICWNEATCAAAVNAFNDNVVGVEDFFEAVNRGNRRVRGFMDTNGPLGTENYIFVPMCTGDFHWGSKTTDYSDSVSVSHMGSVNVMSVFDWLFQQSTAVEISQLVLTGSDSGSYASIVYSGVISSWLRVVAPSVHLVQHGDGGLGLFYTDFLEAIPNAWGLSIRNIERFVVDGGAGSIPSWFLIPDSTAAVFDLGITDLNRTLLNTCLESTNATLALEDFGKFVNGDLPQDVEDCIVDVQNSSTITLFPVNASAFNSTQRTINPVSIEDRFIGADSEVLQQLLQREQCTIQGLETDFEETDSCINLTVFGELNISVSSLFAEDLSSFLTNTDVQVIPSMYLLLSYQFPEYVWSQTSSSFDYGQSSAVASQILGSITQVTSNEQKLWHEYVSILYDTYLPLMPSNYYHYFIQGDSHGNLGSHRFYRILNNQFYQIFYQWIERLQLLSDFPTRYDCRNATIACNETGFDSRENIVYYED